jgi:predicted transcriptional regulator of viral defense system
MNEYSQVRLWIDELPKRGKTFFTLKEAEEQFPNKPAASVRRAIARLSDVGKVHSVWKGFYAISLPEYGLHGIVPPQDYFDQLAQYLGVGYYMALLTAASYQGAAHQSPQAFYIICDSILHPKIKNSVRIEPAYKKIIPEKYVSKINSRTASVNISTPELTAIDLIVYTKRAGGISQVATVLSELADSMDFGRVDADFFSGASTAAFQRLGYILDMELGEKELAESLYDKAKQACVNFKTTPLVMGRNHQSELVEKNKKWGIIINYKVEADL